MADSAIGHWNFLGFDRLNPRAKFILGFRHLLTELYRIRPHMRTANRSARWIRNRIRIQAYRHCYRRCRKELARVQNKHVLSLFRPVTAAVAQNMGLGTAGPHPLGTLGHRPRPRRTIEWRPDGFFRHSKGLGSSLWPCPRAWKLASDFRIGSASQKRLGAWL